ncbi:hypothetical protein K469DRAFT_687744 [Zopfia rhizophila CBS 207.26]|uniref:Uncharacterized protein n=1 Tax=Zopfia rhizophila CBS 207.26 TaxID=1314779 RepID=A0A6A6E5T6_9PEZI|nr:hypothetical protein K469DRAFT_687744 [Zopfia rhizophila CBS 207.26]
MKFDSGLLFRDCYFMESAREMITKEFSIDGSEFNFWVKRDMIVTNMHSLFFDLLEIYKDLRTKLSYCSRVPVGKVMYVLVRKGTLNKSYRDGSEDTRQNWTHLRQE